MVFKEVVIEVDEGVTGVVSEDDEEGEIEVALTDVEVAGDEEEVEGEDDWV